MCIIVPNFIKIDQKVAEIWRINCFKMVTVRLLGFLKFNFLNGRSGEETCGICIAKCDTHPVDNYNLGLSRRRRQAGGKMPSHLLTHRLTDNQET